MPLQAQVEDVAFSLREVTTDRRHLVLVVHRLLGTRGLVGEVGATIKSDKLPSRVALVKETVQHRFLEESRRVRQMVFGGILDPFHEVEEHVVENGFELGVKL